MYAISVTYLVMKAAIAKYSDAPTPILQGEVG
jgi:hypothetical protein